MNPIKAFITSFLKKAFLKLSQADGKEGLSVDDFLITVARVVSKSTMDISGREKSEAVSGWIGNTFGPKVAPWITNLLTFVAYLYAQQKGSLK